MSGTKPVSRFRCGSKFSAHHQTHSTTNNATANLYLINECNLKVHFTTDYTFYYGSGEFARQRAPQSSRTPRAAIPLAIKTPNARLKAST